MNSSHFDCHNSFTEVTYEESWTDAIFQHSTDRFKDNKVGKGCNMQVIVSDANIEEIFLHS